MNNDKIIDQYRKKRVYVMNLVDQISHFIIYGFYVFQKFIAFIKYCLDTHSVCKHCHMLSLGLQISLLGIA